MNKAFRIEIERLQSNKDDPRVSKWIDGYEAEISRMEEDLKRRGES